MACKGTYSTMVFRIKKQLRELLIIVSEAYQLYIQSYIVSSPWKHATEVE